MKQQHYHPLSIKGGREPLHITSLVEDFDYKSTLNTYRTVTQAEILTSRQTDINTYTSSGRQLFDRSEQITLQFDWLDSFQRLLRHANTSQRVFYNRVPKCGSEGAVAFIRSVAKRNRFRVRRSSLKTERHINESQQVRARRSPCLLVGL